MEKIKRFAPWGLVLVMIVIFRGTAILAYLCVTLALLLIGLRAARQGIQVHVVLVYSLAWPVIVARWLLGLAGDVAWRWYRVFLAAIEKLGEL